jgi:hypothetical protein
VPPPSANTSRNTTHAKLESSWASTSGRSAETPGASPSELTVASCGAADSVVPNARRAKTRPASPHTTIATPSAETAIFERPGPIPAWRAGSMSSAPGSTAKPVALRSLRATSTSPPPPPLGTVNDT